MEWEIESMMTLLAVCLCIGVVVGLLAGLFGVGGGVVIVPMLLLAMPWQNTSDANAMRLALGTSLACIMFTSISSFMAHHRRGAVLWSVVWRIVPGIVTGTLLGSAVAAHAPASALKTAFILFLFMVSFQMLLDRKPIPSRKLPGKAGIFGAGGVIGGVSSLVGIGGGALTVPFMLWCNISAREAVGTSAAIGFPIAVSGAAAYLYNGFGVVGLPDWSMGFIYLPALLGIVAASSATAPLGVRLAHSLPAAKLKRGFALLLMVVGIKMLCELF